VTRGNMVFSVTVSVEEASGPKPANHRGGYYDAGRLCAPNT
jgi:hypothetical protein